MVSDSRIVIRSHFRTKPHAVAAAPQVILTPAAGTPFTGTVGTFTDTDANANLADFTALIDWGDGRASPGQVTAAVGGGFKVSGSNTYTAGGDFTITFTVEDFGGARVIGHAEARVPPPLFLPIVEH
jgi:hypothetical protein